MTFPPITRRNGGFQSAMALAFACTLTGCSANDRKGAGQMTSYSANASTSATPQLFTLPQDQIADPPLAAFKHAVLTAVIQNEADEFA